MADLTFIMSLSMIALQIPGPASTVQEIFLQLIQLDILFPERWLTPLLSRGFTDEELDEDAEPTLTLGQMGYGSYYVVFNLGSTLTFLVLNSAMVALIHLLAPLSGLCTW